MKVPLKSILVITPDAAVSQAIGTALGGDPALKVDTKSSSLTQLNGQAVKFAQEHDFIIFDTDPGNEADLRAIEDLAKNRREGTILLALASSDISLAEARKLTRAGVDEVLPYPITGAELTEQLERLGARAVPDTRRGSGRIGRVIAVAQARGGSGATTVALNLADALTGKGGLLHKADKHTVALVDFDLQFGTIGTALDLEEQDSMLKLAQDGTVPDLRFLEQSMTKFTGGLSVLPAPSKFAPVDALRNDQVATIIDLLRQTNDYVVVDLPRALVSWVEPVIEEADELLIVTDLAVPSVRHARRLMDFFKTVNIGLPMTVVLNREHRPLIRSSVHKEAAAALDSKLEFWLPLDDKAARAAVDQGKPLTAVAGRSPLTKAIGHLAKAITKALPAAARVEASR
ncbi:AAA family ATPase [Defluviimonas sp. WL0002]|uniref:AAA family ATPase n=1 Tax=Albidovulum marisflavi TaxID=2984159 RepID=A0ABT2ZA34_9RHOB|nr:AAA family ATPase [Defluviimonas sp. WL0002]MCV2867989.1 AAA family ATPase [Defluviimonas sp. WL0002]